MSENPLKSIESEIEKQPWYVWAGALGGGAVVFYYVMKQRASQAASAKTASSNATPTTATNDTAAQNAALNGYDISSMAGLPYGDMSGYTSTSGPVDNYPMPSSGTPTPTTASGQQEGLVRPRFNSDTTKAYDTKFPQGVPIHSSPSSSSPVVSFAQYASQVAITGTPTPGSNNFGTNSTTGSGLWFPVSGGYISGYDLVGFFTLPAQNAMAQGSGGFQSFLNAGRNTVDVQSSLYGLMSE